MQTVPRRPMKHPRAPNPGSPGRPELTRLLEATTDAGDTQAARRLVQLYSERLYGLAYRILGDRQGAEDVVQDLFVSLLEGKARYRGKGHPDAFLLRVTTFLALDRAKGASLRRRKEEAAAMNHHHPEVPSQAPPALDVVLEKEIQEELSTLIAELSPEARAVVALRFWHGATIREIASILSSTRSTVSRWLDGALHTLRRPLVRRGFGAVVLAGTLERVVQGMEAPPPSAGFEAALSKAVLSGTPSSTTAALPSIPEAGGSLLTSKTAMLSGVAAVLVTVLVTMSLGLLSPKTPPDGRTPAEEGPALVAPDSPTAAGSTAEDPQSDTPIASGDRRAAGGVVLSGRVVHGDGRPASGAALRLYPGEGSLPADYSLVTALAGGPLAEGRTSPDGRFRFTGIEPGSYRILALARGAGPGTSGLLRTGMARTLGGISIALPPGGTVEGTARLETGEPVEGVRLQVFLPITLGKIRAGFWPATVTSDRNGRLRIPAVESPAAEMLVESDSCYVVEAPKYARAGEGPIEVVLSRGLAVAGRVVDPGGDPVEAAEVLAFSTTVHMEGARKSPRGSRVLTRRALTAADGRFALQGLYPEEHIIHARATPWALSGPVTLNLSTGEKPTEELLLRLRRGSFIEGQFLQDGRPLGPARGVALQAPDANRAPAAPLLRNAYGLDPLGSRVDAHSFDVGQDGGFRVDALPPGEYVLFACRSPLDLLELLQHRAVRGGTSPSRPPTFHTGEKDARVEVPSREPEISLEGEVVDLEGRGVPRARVRCEFGFDGSRRTGVDVDTDQNGVFRLVTVLPAGEATTLKLVAETPSGEAGQLEGIPLEDARALEGLRVVIGAGPSISGRITSPAGEPVEGATVRLWQDGHEPFPRARERTTKTDSTGWYRFSAIDENRRYLVHVEADGWAVAELFGLEVGRTDADLVLREESVIRGRVLDPEGRPVEFDGLSVSRHDATTTSGLASNVSHEGEGRFALRGLAGGEYSLEARGEADSRGRAPVSRWSDRIRVAEGETVEGVVLVLTRLVAIEGQVVDAVTGTPVADAVVADWDPLGDTFPRGRLRGTTDPQGRFRLEGFARGNTRLHAVADGYLKTELSVGVSGEEDEEVLIRLSPARVLELLVVDEAGRPVEEALIFTGFNWPERTLTGADGLAHVEIPARGSEAESKSEAWVEVQKNGHTSARVELEDEPVIGARLTITLPRGGTLRGTVVDHEGVPLEGLTVTVWKDRHGRGSRTKEQGAYTIGGLPPGECEVRLTSTLKPLPTLRKTVMVAVGREARVDFTLPDPAAWSLHPVRIVGTFDDGAPAARTRIHVNNGWIGSGRERRDVSPLPFFTEQDDLRLDERGTLEVLFEEPGVKELSLSGKCTRDGALYRIVESRAAVEGGIARVVFERIPLGDVTLSAIDAVTGKPVEEYRYFFRTKGHGGSGSRCRDPDGVVHDKVRAGDITLEVTAEGYRDLERPFRLEDGARVRLDLELLPE